MPVDKHGFDTDNKGFSGVNDWEDLPEIYKRADIIFQEIENLINDRVRLFKCVKTDSKFDYLQDRVFDEIKMWMLVEDIEHGPIGDLEAQVVWLNGKYDDSRPNNMVIGEDDINRDKLDDFKNIGRW
ncbi:MAG: hypothetical protein ACOCRO_05420 [Halanaerobiales bacterium]